MNENYEVKARTKLRNVNWERGVFENIGNIETYGKS